jgi:hypothetical protein
MKVAWLFCMEGMYFVEGMFSKGSLIGEKGQEPDCVHVSSGRS